MKSVGLILAKKDSRRLKDKNFLDFAGEPMFAWNLKKMQEIFDEVYVSSDFDEILSKAKEVGALAIKRSAELCGDVPNIPVYRHAFEAMENKPDIIVAVQANSPTVRAELIKEAKEIMERGFFEELMTCDEDFKLYGSIWALTKDRLEKYGNPYKQTPQVLLVDESIDIHTEDDLNKAKQQVNK